LGEEPIYVLLFDIYVAHDNLDLPVALSVLFKELIKFDLWEIVQAFYWTADPVVDERV